MKLLFVINQFYKGGAETTLLNLLRGLDPTQHEVDLLVYDQLKLDHVVSLLPLIPDWVQVCDAAADENQIAFVKKAWNRIYRDVTKKQRYRPECYAFVKNKHYDAAISYGEWFTPEFVANHVVADRKLVWIHSDIDKAQFFEGSLVFQHDENINLYLFVSKRSMEAALKLYPHLYGRAAIVHNICNDAGICETAKEPAPEMRQWKRPIVLTVANFRAEKNHLRQVEAMQILKQRGVRFTWVNIGSDTDTILTGKIDAAVRRCGLEDCFIRRSADPNPYRYIKEADAVAVLSDFESWSLVITEAKLLETPVIATRTSGALEQIEERQTGMLCDFEAENIADQLEILLRDKALQRRIRANLKGFSTRRAALSEFEQALEKCRCGRRPSLLYVSDDINYVSGVQKVTATQAEALQEHLSISLFSMTVPDERSRELFRGIPIYDMQQCCGVTCLPLPFKEVMFKRRFSLRQKAVRLAYAVARRLGRGDWALEMLSNQKMRRFFEAFDTVCVLSEASQMRGFVGELRHPRKVQWIHTDYALWSTYSDWTKNLTRNDSELYEHYDQIVCLSNASKNGFINKYPHLSEKTNVIANIQPVDQILAGAKEGEDKVSFDPNVLNIVSVGRMDTEKAVDRILRVCARLKVEGFRFNWYFIGDGVLLKKWTELNETLGLKNFMHFLGAKKNPYPYMAKADLFALLSRYEGLPVTIDEAKILHVPVFATKVGGIVEQVKDGETGMLVENDEEAIYEGLKILLSNPERLSSYKEYLKTYRFEREQIIMQLLKVFSRETRSCIKVGKLAQRSVK